MARLRALSSELYVHPLQPATLPRFVFLSPRAHVFFADWERAANDIVANLRTEAGRDSMTGAVGSGPGAVHAQRGVPHPGPSRGQHPGRRVDKNVTFTNAAARQRRNSIVRGQKVRLGITYRGARLRLFGGRCRR